MHAQEGYGTYFVCVCVCVSVCVESTAQEQTLYNKLSVAADFSLRFQLTEVASFTSYRPFRSFFEVVAILLHDELPHAPYTHVQAGFCMECTINHLAFLRVCVTLELKDHCCTVLPTLVGGGGSQPSLSLLLPQLKLF